MQNRPKNATDDSLKCANVSPLPPQGGNVPDFEYELSAPLPVGPVGASMDVKEEEVEEPEEPPPLPPPRFPPPPSPPKAVSWQSKKHIGNLHIHANSKLGTNILIPNPFANLASGTF